MTIFDKEICLGLKFRYANKHWVCLKLGKINSLD